ncbi:MAG TPA: hypothetical protein VFY45_21300 [Baekduia sp.]|nr:hypothetical protein [Baekduia sp.]
MRRLCAHRAANRRAQLGAFRAIAPDTAQQLEVLLARVFWRDAEYASDREVIDSVLKRALAAALVDRAALGFMGVEQRP